MSASAPAVNQVTLVGNLTADPVIKQLDEDRKVCQLRLAVNDVKDQPMFIDVATFGAQAEACAKYLTKGRAVAVTGRLVYREWDENGTRRSRHHSVNGHNPSSGMFVFPTTIAPAARNRRTTSASAGADVTIAPVPWLVTSPAISISSLTATGRPRSGARSPTATRASASVASRSARSGYTARNAFISPSRRRIWASASTSPSASPDGEAAAGR